MNAARAKQVRRAARASRRALDRGTQPAALRRVRRGAPTESNRARRSQDASIVKLKRRRRHAEQQQGSGTAWDTEITRHQRSKRGKNTLRSDRVTGRTAGAKWRRPDRTDGGRPRSMREEDFGHGSGKRERTPLRQMRFSERKGRGGGGGGGDGVVSRVPEAVAIDQNELAASSTREGEDGQRTKTTSAVLKEDRKARGAAHRRRWL
ncbi:hypothetical protein ERJ75_000617900 [Trypanosoma vivax]|nr:hypothetical protein ERJ75_000617900 [Trypanosoma vivax]